MSIYVYGELDVENSVKCSSNFKDPIPNATLVYTDDEVIKRNYEANGVEVKPLTEKKQARAKKK